jgi:transcription initiation factor TFIIF subunit alpha
MPASSASSLFHPKKKKVAPGPRLPNAKGNGSPSPTKAAAPKPPRPQSQPKDDLDESGPQLPTTPFTEYKLVSTSLEGWKYNVMKLESRKPVKFEEWEQPVKLNRKELRRADDAAGPSTQVPVQPMLGLDGKPVIGADGRIVMVDADGRPIHNSNAGGGSGGGMADKDGKAKMGPKKFQKKTKQVFLVPEATRQLRKEERYPWVMEDATGREVWVGQMEEAAKSETHALLVPSEGNAFKFVPAHRWYKFQKRPHYKIPDLEEAEHLVRARAARAVRVFSPRSQSWSRCRRCRRTRTPSGGCSRGATGRARRPPPRPCSRPKPRDGLSRARGLWCTTPSKAWVPAAAGCGPWTAAGMLVCSATMT